MSGFVESLGSSDPDRWPPQVRAAKLALSERTAVTRVMAGVRWSAASYRAAVRAAFLPTDT